MIYACTFVNNEFQSHEKKSLIHAGNSGKEVPNVFVFLTLTTTCYFDVCTYTYTGCFKISMKQKNL